MSDSIEFASVVTSWVLKNHLTEAVLLTTTSDEMGNEFQKSPVNWI